MDFSKVISESEKSSDSNSSHSLDENLSASNFNLSLDNVIGMNGTHGRVETLTTVIAPGQTRGVKPNLTTQKAMGNLANKEDDDDESDENHFGNEESNSVAEFNYEIDPSSILLQSHSPEPMENDNSTNNCNNNSDQETNYFQEETHRDTDPCRPKRKKRYRKSSLALSVLTKLKVEQSSYRKALLFYLLKKHLSK